MFCNGVLTGVVSTGQGCADPEFPGIYSDVTHYFPWIRLNAAVDLKNDNSTPTSTVSSDSSTGPQIDVTEKTSTGDDDLTRRNFSDKLGGNISMLLILSWLGIIMKL